MHLLRITDPLGIRIDQYLMGVEPVPVPRLVRPVYAGPVILAGPDVRDIKMPYIVGTFPQLDALCFGFSLFGVKQTQFDAVGMMGEKGKVNALSIPGGAQ